MRLKSNNGWRGLTLLAKWVGRPFIQIECKEGGSFRARWRAAQSSRSPSLSAYEAIVIPKRREGLLRTSVPDATNTLSLHHIKPRTQRALTVPLARPSV